MKKMKKGLLICLMTLLAALCLAVAACGGGGGITFKFVMGEGAPKMEDVELEEGAEYTLPTPPEWEGHSFEGWYLDADFTGSPVTSQKAEEDTTFYAKWDTMYLVTLNLDGGTLQNTTLYLKAGANLAEALASYVPTKTGFLFGEWLNGTSALAANAKMPQENITLTAHYKVGYTVEAYLQDRTDETKYTKAAEDYTGYAYANSQPFTPDYAPTGYEAVEHEGAVTTLTLDGSDLTKNHFKIYYNLKEVTVNFLANTGDPSDKTMAVTGKYGDKIDLPTAAEFTREGYLLAGWSENGEAGDMVPVVHPTENAAFTPAQYELTENVALLAVWQKGSSDVFGGGDHLYVIGDAIYLERAGYLFSGEKLGDDGRYTFKADGTIRLTCKVFANGTFCFENKPRGETTAQLYDITVGAPDENATIAFDTFNGLRYMVADENGATVTYTGTYYVDEDGNYRTQFETASSGDPIEDFTFLISQVEDDSGDDVNVFIIRNDEDPKLGTLPMLYATPNGAEENEYGIDIALDGFGFAAFGENMTAEAWETFFGEDTDPDDYAFTYYFDEESFEGVRLLVLYIVDLSTYQQQMFGTFVVGTFKDSENKDIDGFIYFDTETFGTYEEEDNGGGTLTLDGLSGATFVKDGKTVKGYYEATESTSGDTIVYVYKGNEFVGAFNIIITPVADEEGNYTYEYSYVQYADYSEYYYATDDGLGYPFMISGITENAFELYLADREGTRMYRVATGTLELKGRLYTATVKEHSIDPEYVTELGLKNDIDDEFDVTKLKSFTFALLLYQDQQGNQYMLMSWFSYTLEGTNGDDVHPLGGKYTEQGEGKTGMLTVYNGTASYTDKDGKTYVGGFSDQELFYALSVDSQTAFYFTLDEDKSTYQLLDADKLDIVYMLIEGSYIDPTTFLFYDGLGKTFYCTVDTTTYEITKTECTITTLTEKAELTEEVLYSCTYGNTTFKFFRIDDEEAGSVFIKELTGPKGTFRSADGGDELVLDGFMYAEYASQEAGVAFGVYSFDTSMGENCIMFIGVGSSEGIYLYIDLNKPAEGKFTVRGEECCDSLLFDNFTRDEYLSFDGYGKLEVYTMEEDASGSGTGSTGTGSTSTKYTRKVVATGSYTIEDGIFKLQYTYTAEAGGAKVTAEGTLSYVRSGSDYLNVFYVLHKQVSYIYLNPEDWSVMELDGYGNALFRNPDGTLELGYYNLLDDDLDAQGTGKGLLYFANESGSISGIYEFNTTTREIKLCEFEATGYYTEDFDSLLFYSDGIVAREGEMLCFFAVDAQDNVSLYYYCTDESQKDVSADKINKYGFVKVAFGKFTDNTVTFENKTYYRNSGLYLTFKRTGNTTEYPIPASNVTGSIQDLIFAPSASGNAVSGQVSLKIDGVDEWAGCVVTPDEAKNNKFTVSLSMGYSGYLDLDITITYAGEEKSTYTVTGMRYVIEMMSASYFQGYEFFEQLGMSFPDVFGTLSLMQEYDKDGKEIGGFMLTSDLGEGSGFLDTKGQILQIPEDTECVEYEVKADATAGTSAYSYWEAWFKDADDYEYCLDFQMDADQNYGVYLYYVLALTRVQTFTQEDIEGQGPEGYDLRIARVVTADSSSLLAGDILDISFLKEKEDGTYDVAKYEFRYTSDYKTIVFAFKDADATTYTHYIVTLTDGTVPDEDTVPAYASVSIEKKTATLYFTADEAEEIAVYQDGDELTVAYIDFDPSDPESVEFYAATKTEKAADGSYTVTLDDETQYKLTITGDTVTLEAIEAEPEVTPEEG